MSSSEVGVGWVRLVPSMRGFSREASKGLRTGLAQPSTKAGKAAGSSIVDGISQSVGRARGRFRSLASGIGDIFVTGLKGAGLAGGAALALGVQQAMQREAQTDRVAATFADPQTGAMMGRLAGELYNEAFGDSIADTGEAIRRVFQTGLAGAGNVTDEEMKAITRRVLTFTDVMDADLEKTTRAVSRMVKSGIADSSEDALNILTRGFQLGADQADDLLDTFAEYSTQFREIGISAEEATGLMVQGLRAGARDSDVVADALKELAIRAQDGSIASARGFELLGLNGERMTAQFAQGGEAARDAFAQILDQVKNLEDPVARNAAAVALFGTKAEDLQDALFALDLDTAASELGDTEDATDDLASAYDNAATRIESFKRRALERLTLFVGNSVIPGLERLAAVVGPVLSEAWDNFRDAMADVDFTEVRRLARFLVEDALPAMLDALTRFSVFVVEDVVPVVNDAIALMGRAWDEHGDDVVEVVGTMLAKVQEFGNWMLDEAWPAVRDAIGFMADKWDEHDEDVKAALDATRGVIRDFYFWIEDTAVPAVQRAIGFLSDKWREHDDTVIGVTKSLTSSVWGFLVWLGGIGISAATEAIDALKSLWESLKPTVESVIDFVVRQWDRIIRGIDSASDAVRGFIETLAGVQSNVSTNINVSRTVRETRQAATGRGGGRSTRSFHGGGIVPGFPGEDVPILARAGEGVFTSDQLQALGVAGSTQPAPTQSVVVIDADNLDRSLLEWLRRSVRVEGGGDVQLALGGTR